VRDDRSGIITGFFYASSLAGEPIRLFKAKKTFIPWECQHRTMFERIMRSFGLVKASWRVLMDDKKLLAFPIMSGIVTLLVIATFVLPLNGLNLFTTNSVTGIVLLFLFYLVSYFVVIFFNVGLISCVHAKLNGKNMTVGEGLSAAGRHIGSIVAWAVIAATVGLILRMIEDRAGFLGQIAAAVVGGVWSLITLFVVPVLAFEDKNVFSAMKESLELFKKTWGESVVGTISITLIFTAIGAVGLLLAIGTLFTGNGTLILVAFALLIVFVAVLAILASAMQGIFTVALYTYAKTGSAPGIFAPGLVEGAFAPANRQNFGPGNI
jgi:membrane-anchored glycerophosphoryl diester phosphodiesterase (GDPDase)